jgi:hypothetical protein
MDLATCTFPVPVRLDRVILRMNCDKIIVIVNCSCNAMGRETDSNRQVLYVLQYWIHRRKISMNIYSLLTVRVLLPLVVICMYVFWN